MEKGIKFGKKKKLTEDQIKQLKIDRSKYGIKIKDLMLKYNLSKASIYRYLSANKT